jgi:nitrate/TMAO reductase-like tetraheme cytochrome c subunit
MKNIKLFFLFLKDLFGWYSSSVVFRSSIYYDCESVKELWCHYFGHDTQTWMFHDVHVRDNKTTHEHGFATLGVCRRCHSHAEDLFVQTTPLGKP